MALLSTVFYTLLTLLGLRISPDSPPTDGIGGMSCSGLQVRDGSVSCSNDGQQTVCKVFCDGEDRGEFTCSGNGEWTPTLPTCARPIEDRDDYDDYDDYDDSQPKAERRQGGVSCSGLQVRDGSVRCLNEGRKTVCQVFCEGKDHGEFTCTGSKGWSPKLPTCAKPIQDRAAVATSCPDDSKCSIEPQRLKSTCIEKVCMEECTKKPLRLIGKCVKGYCKCIIYASQP